LSLSQKILTEKLAQYLTTLAEFLVIKILSFDYGFYEL